MPDEASNQPDPFNLRTIRQLVALMSEHDLSEIDLQKADRRIRLRRGPRVVSTTSFPTLPTPVAVPAPVSTPAAEAAAPPPDKPAKALVEIKSPTVGTFYARPKPDAEPYVQVGSRVTPTTVVGLIEAMKIYNDITAGCNGVVTEILVENQQPVEFDQVLFKVDPTA